MLSLPHLAIIFLVALLVFGPEKLPELARNFGKVMAEFRRVTGDLRTGFEEQMRELDREARVSTEQKTHPAPALSRETETASSAAENRILPPDTSTPMEAGPETETSAPAILSPSPEPAVEKASDGDS